MKLEKTPLLLLLLISIVIISGCTLGSQDPLVGYWTATEQLTGYQEVLTIQPDNTLYFSSSFGQKVFSYELGEGKIYLTDLDTGQEVTADFEIIGDYKAIKFRGITYYPS